MSQSRLTLALEAGTFTLTDATRIAVFRPRADHDLSALPKAQVQIIQGFKPDHDAWAVRGYSVSPEANGRFDVSVVFVPRSKKEALALIAQAAQTSAIVLVDGQKTDGIDSILKLCKKRATLGGVIAKAHGKLFVITDHDGFSDWEAPLLNAPEGFVTRAGVFSAGSVDAGSALLAEHLPKSLGKCVADLGAGWGYLSRQILQNEGVETLYLAEAEHMALECARLNITDPRARFHWVDATRFKPDTLVDTVVMNPPFHTSRAADPDLGRAFVQAAANMLTPRGHLWMVANRHLPYEETLAACFGRVEEVVVRDGFKVHHAQHPRRGSRPAR